ncbi:hypothetical protein BH23CHL4_BH23CHL4_10660 [soil metagenome]
MAERAGHFGDIHEGGEDVSSVATPLRIAPNREWLAAQLRHENPVRHRSEKALHSSERYPAVRVGYGYYKKAPA